MGDDNWCFVDKSGPSVVYRFAEDWTADTIEEARAHALERKAVSDARRIKRSDAAAGAEKP